MGEGVSKLIASARCSDTFILVPPRRGDGGTMRMRSPQQSHMNFRREEPGPEDPVLTVREQNEEQFL